MNFIIFIYLLLGNGMGPCIQEWKRNGNGFFWLRLPQLQSLKIKHVQKICDGKYQPVEHLQISSTSQMHQCISISYQCVNDINYVSRQDNSINSPRSIRPAVKIRRSGPVLSCGPSALLAWPCSDSRELHLQPKVNRKAGTGQKNVIFLYFLQVLVPDTLHTGTKWNN